MLIARSDSSDAGHDLPKETMIMHVDDLVNPASLGHSSQLIVAAVRQTLFCPCTLTRNAMSHVCVWAHQRRLYSLISRI